MSEPSEHDGLNPYEAPAPAMVGSPASYLPNDASIRLLFERGKNGAAWFYWIAALSLVNTVMILAGGGLAFALGLNITIIPDHLAAAAALKPDGNTAILIAALTFDAVVLGLFVLCGYLSQRRVLFVYAMGMVVYLLDGLLGFLLVGMNDLLGIGIHAFALWSMWGGFMAYRQLNRLQHEAMQAATFTGV